MRFLITLVVIAACVAAVGLYRGWFHVTSDRAVGQPSITVTVDKGKMQADKQKAVDKVQDLEHRAKDHPTAPAQPTTNPQ